MPRDTVRGPNCVGGSVAANAGEIPCAVLICGSGAVSLAAGCGGSAGPEWRRWPQPGVAAARFRAKSAPRGARNWARRRRSLVFPAPRAAKSRRRKRHRWSMPRPARPARDRRACRPGARTAAGAGRRSRIEIIGDVAGAAAIGAPLLRRDRGQRGRTASAIAGSPNGRWRVRGRAGARPCRGGSCRGDSSKRGNPNIMPRLSASFLLYSHREARELVTLRDCKPAALG